MLQGLETFINCNSSKQYAFIVQLKQKYFMHVHSKYHLTAQITICRFIFGYQYRKYGRKDRKFFNMKGQKRLSFDACELARILLGLVCYSQHALLLPRRRIINVRHFAFLHARLTTLQNTMFFQMQQLFVIDTQKSSAEIMRLI